MEPKLDNVQNECRADRRTCKIEIELDSTHADILEGIKLLTGGGPKEIIEGIINKELEYVESEIKALFGWS